MNYFQKYIMRKNNMSVCLFLKKKYMTLYFNPERETHGVPKKCSHTNIQAIGSLNQGFSKLNW